MNSYTMDLRDGARGEVRLPGSKSFSNRALLLAALASGVTQLRGLLVSDDTAVMLESLRQLGVRIEQQGGDVLVHGVAGRFPLAAKSTECFIGNSGLTIRTLLPAIVAGLENSDASIRLHGVPRMHERPIGDLVDGLLAVGARIEYESNQGFPPLRAWGGFNVSAQTELVVRAQTSSQFLTGILQMAPLLSQRAGNSVVVVRAEGELISRPYVDLTLALLKRFSVKVAEPSPGVFEVQGGLVSPGELVIEGDASSASYFLAAGALGGGPVRVLGVGRDSLQGDIRFADALEKMGARVRWGDEFIETAAGPEGLVGIDLDCNHIPDAAMTLVPMALYAKGSTKLRNIGSWRVKETDRIAAMATEVQKLGATVEVGEDWLVVHPPARLQSASIETYEDHRVAMAFSLAAFRHGGDVNSGGATSGERPCRSTENYTVSPAGALTPSVALQDGHLRRADETASSSARPLTPETAPESVSPPAGALTPSVAPQDGHLRRTNEAANSRGSGVNGPGGETVVCSVERRGHSPANPIEQRTLTIQDPACVNKTFPEYFDVLSDVCAQAVDVIAIDGPTASGKGTVAARVAAALGYRYLDSGSLYRLLALYSLEKASAQGLATEVGSANESTLAAWALEMPVVFVGEQILLDGRDVSQAIRAEAIGNRASEVAALPEVRRSLLRRQRDWARAPGLVADGRDMGSVVFLQAATKVFLTATPEARAQRRVAQLQARGIQADVATIAADLADRDARDAARPVAPMRFDPESGAVLVDSTAQSIDETVAAVLAAHRIRSRGHTTI